MSWARRKIQTSACGGQSPELCLRGLPASVLADTRTAHHPGLARSNRSSCGGGLVRVGRYPGHMPDVVCGIASALLPRRARGTLTAFPPAWAYFVLVITIALLLRAAWTDLREYKIRNELILTLATLFVLYTVLTGHWASLKWDVPFAALMFLVMLA